MAVARNGTWKWLAGILAVGVISSAGWFVSHTTDEYTECKENITMHASSDGHPVSLERIGVLQSGLQAMHSDIVEIRRDQRKILLEIQTLKGRIP